MDARWYSSDLARFTSPDYYNLQQLALPAGARHQLLPYLGKNYQDLLRDPAQQMRYGYVMGNGLTYLDWLGLSAYPAAISQPNNQANDTVLYPASESDSGYRGTGQMPDGTLDLGAGLGAAINVSLEFKDGKLYAYSLTGGVGIGASGAWFPNTTSVSSGSPSPESGLKTTLLGASGCYGVICMKADTSINPTSPGEANPTAGGAVGLGIGGFAMGAQTGFRTVIESPGDKNLNEINCP